MLGTFGDMFGFLNAVFSGVAFAAIYYTLRIQQKQHDIQESELNMKREMAFISVDEVESREVFQTTVPGQSGPQCPACYVRLVLKNEARMPAKGCRVMLTAIEKKRPGEQYSVVRESKLTLRLLQPTEDDNAPEERAFTIPHNLPHYFNVCSVKRDPPAAPAVRADPSGARKVEISGFIESLRARLRITGFTFPWIRRIRRRWPCRWWFPSGTC